MATDPNIRSTAWAIEPDSIGDLYLWHDGSRIIAAPGEVGPELWLLCQVLAGDLGAPAELLSRAHGDDDLDLIRDQLRQAGDMLRDLLDAHAEVTR